MVRKSLRSNVNGVLIAVLVAGILGAGIPGAQARNSWSGGNAPAQVSGSIASAQLPREGIQTLNRIAAGGPYSYAKDGIVFGNRERLLPPHRRGYYHEYTVRTPGERSRGARRIICGGPLRHIDNCYYTDDHYASFKRIVE